MYTDWRPKMQHVGIRNALCFVSDSSSAIDSPSDQVLYCHALPASVGQATTGHEEIFL